MSLDDRILKERPEVPPATLQEITKLAGDAIELEHLISLVEADLDKYRKQLHELRFDLIPGRMLEAGLASFKLADGSSVKVEDYVQGSLPKDPVNRQAAIIVLERAGGDALIKNQVVCDFERKQHNRAIEIARELQDRGLQVKVQQDVHHSTLQAFVREKLRRGEELAYEKLGIFVGRRAVITPQKGEEHEV